MSAHTTQLSRLLLVLTMALAIVTVLPAVPFVGGNAYAQQAGERSGGGILRFLFQRREPQRMDRPAPRTEQPRRAPTVRRSQPSVTAAPAIPTVEKAEDAKRILIIGDFLASGLADGLTTAYEQSADALVVDRANGSSGLVRDDYYDWPNEIGPLLDAEKPAVVVVMIGSNDRQQMRVGDARQPHLSDPWKEEYERRATALTKAVRDRGLPLIWVGNLPFKGATMSSDMIAFNDIYRRIVTDAGGEFVDVWDGFVDETGSFVTNGPDMNGQPAQLRSSDGINVTRQGRRKIAFYVEKPLARLLGTDGGAGGIARLPGDPQGPALDGASPVEIDRTTPISLDDYSLDVATDLLGAEVGAKKNEEAKTPAERLTREGVGATLQPGRADDFTVRRTPAPDPGKTTSVTP